MGYLVETEVIKPTDYRYEQCKELCTSAALLHNASLYEFRQSFFAHREAVESGLDGTDQEVNLLTYKELVAEFTRTNQPDYRRLPAKVAQTVVKGVANSFKSFYGARNAYYTRGDYKKAKEQRIPKYIKGDKLYVVEFNCQTVKEDWSSGSNVTKHKGKVRYNYVICPKSLALRFVAIHQIKTVKIVPCGTIFKLVKCYETDTCTSQQELLDNGLYVDNGNYAAIDLGANNLATMVNNVNFIPLLISGAQVKSVNRQYAKVDAKLKSYLDNTKKGGEKGKNRKSTRRLRKNAEKRNRGLNALLHEYSRFIANYLASWYIHTLYIGYNQGWKQGAKLGSRANQNFVSIPHLRFVEMIEYKCARLGIRVIRVSEWYTSKCSFLDGERICKHKEYAGERFKRGLFRTAKGIVWNADVNAAWNILCLGNTQVSQTLDRECVERFVVNPGVVRASNNPWSVGGSYDRMPTKYRKKLGNRFGENTSEDKLEKSLSRLS